MGRDRLLGFLAVAGALMLFWIAGAAFKWYVWDIVIQQAGEADRSMLFWGIPIAFVGIGAAGMAGTLVFLARRLLRTPEDGLDGE